MILDVLKGKEDIVGFNLSEFNTIYNLTEKEAKVSEILEENISIEIIDKDNFILIKSLH